MTNPADIQLCEKEILAGLPNETKRLDHAKTNIEVYNGNHHDPEMIYYDADKRARRDLPLMSKVIDALTGFTYQDPPTRIVHDQANATKYLEKVYNQNQMTTLLRASDRYRHAGDIFAIQVHPTGDPEKPIKCYGWTADSFVWWVDSSDQTEPVAVCTIDRYDNQTRYRLWTDTECRTYITKKWNGETSGGRVPFLQSIEPHNFGIIPFAYQHYRLPVTQFSEGGIGCILSQMERHVNFRLMETSDHLRFSKPRGFLMGVSADKELGRRPRAGELERFAARSADARNEALLPHVEWLTPPMDWVDKEWDDLRYYWNWMLESVGVPAASIPLDKAIIATVSGAALIARNIPLFLYAKNSQEQYRHYEAQLAKVVMTVTDKTYGGFTDALKDFDLIVNFGEVVPDLPPDSKDDYLDDLLVKGELSEIQVVMKRFNFTRDQALEHMEQVAKDAADLAKIRAKHGALPEDQDQKMQDQQDQEDNDNGDS
jgi:hypothetical protein